MLSMSLNILMQVKPFYISDESSGWYEDVLPGTTGNQHVPKRSCQGFPTRWVIKCFVLTPLLHDPREPPAQTRLPYFLTQPLWWHSSKHILYYCPKINVLETGCLKESRLKYCHFGKCHWLYCFLILLSYLQSLWSQSKGAFTWAKMYWGIKYVYVSILNILEILSGFSFLIFYI